MIAAFTLNLSIDRRYIVDNAAVNAVNRVKECTFTAGGKGLNVARIIHAMGGDVIAGGFSGGNLGHCIEGLLDNEGIPYHFTHTKNETRCCINILDRVTGTQTEFLEPGLPVTDAEYAAFLTDFDALCAQCSVITMSGSLPKGVPADTYATLIRRAREFGRIVLLDTSGTSLTEAMKANPYYIKPNEDEIAALTGCRADDEAAVIRAAKALQAQGIDRVVVSLGKRGALMVCDAGVFHGIPPKIKAVNTVGCGDSMTGAFAMAAERGDDPEQALRFAIAVSAASAMSEGTGGIDRADFEAIYPQVTVRKLD